MHNDLSLIIRQQIEEAYQTESPLTIIGNDTKKFYGPPIEGTPLIMNQYSGILNYEPTELVITACAGTPLNEIESLLDQNGQQLAFEPPHFIANDPTNDESRIATLGGNIACGLSGPARANNGAVRDFILGCEIINGKGEQLKFGGQVMKNVAGYDVSRLICGSLGTLGVILNVSLKVLPKPETTTSLSFALSREDAYQKLCQWSSKPYPITASCYYDGQLTLRLAGNTQAVKATQSKLGGDPIKDGTLFWRTIREQQHPFFNTDKPLWRVSTKPIATLPIDVVETDYLSEWHGALHWLKTDSPAAELRRQIEQLGGHATLFRNNVQQDETFHPLSIPLFTLHKNLKNAFDPKDILNRNKMYNFNQ